MVHWEAGVVLIVLTLVYRRMLLSHDFASQLCCRQMYLWSTLHMGLDMFQGVYLLAQVPYSCALPYTIALRHGLCFRATDNDNGWIRQHSAK